MLPTYARAVMEKYPSRRLDIAIRVAFVVTVTLVIWRWPKAVHVSPSFDWAKVGYGADN